MERCEGNEDLGLQTETLGAEGWEKRVGDETDQAGA